MEWRIGREKRKRKIEICVGKGGKGNRGRKMKTEGGKKRKRKGGK